MPRTRPLTAELQRADQRRRQIVRNCRILNNAARQSEYGTLKAVASELDIPYSTFRQSIQYGSIRAVDMAMVVRLLELDEDATNALLGNPKRCRYE